MEFVPFKIVIWASQSAETAKAKAIEPPRRQERQENMERFFIAAAEVGSAAALFAAKQPSGSNDVMAALAAALTANGQGGDPLLRCGAEIRRCGFANGKPLRWCL